MEFSKVGLEKETGFRGGFDFLGLGFVSALQTVIRYHLGITRFEASSHLWVVRVVSCEADSSFKAAQTKQNIEVNGKVNQRLKD